MNEILRYLKSIFINTDFDILDARRNRSNNGVLMTPEEYQRFFTEIRDVTTEVFDNYENLNHFRRIRREFDFDYSNSIANHLYDINVHLCGSDLNCFLAVKSESIHYLNYVSVHFNNHILHQTPEHIDMITTTIPSVIEAISRISY